MKATIGRTASRHPYFRVVLLLWMSLIIGLLVLIAFGEIGLILSVFIYLISAVLVARMLLKEYRRSQRGANNQRTASLLIIGSMDALAAVAFFLGIVMEAAAPNYGHIYALLGIVLFGVALVVWVNGLMLAITAYTRAERKTGPSIAIGFTLFSILSVLLLLLGSAGFLGG